MKDIEDLKTISHLLDGKWDYADELMSTGERVRRIVERLEHEMDETNAFVKRVQDAVESGIDLDVFGATYTPYPKGKDGKPILLGQKVYGEDGREWTVLRIIIGKRHCVVGNDGSETKEMLPEWLAHERPETVRTIVGKLAMELWDAFRLDMTPLTPSVEDVLDDYSKQLRVRQADVLRRYAESGQPTSVIEDGAYVGSRWVDMDEKVGA